MLIEPPVGATYYKPPKNIFEKYTRLCCQDKIGKSVYDLGALPPHPRFCWPKGLRNVGLWAFPGLRLMIAVGKDYQIINLKIIN